MFFAFFALAASADTVTYYGCGQMHTGCMDPDNLIPALQNEVAKNIIIKDVQNINSGSNFNPGTLADSVETITFINCSNSEIVIDSFYIEVIMGEGNENSKVTVNGPEQYQDKAYYKKYGAPIFFKKNHGVKNYTFTMQTTANLEVVRACSFENYKKDGSPDKDYAKPDVKFYVKDTETNNPTTTDYKTQNDEKVTLLSYIINPGSNPVLDGYACIGSGDGCKNLDDAKRILENTIVNNFEIVGDDTSRDLIFNPPDTMEKLSFKQFSGSLTINSPNIKTVTNNNQNLVLKLSGTGAFQSNKVNPYDKAQCILESGSHGVTKIEYTINDDPTEFWAIAYEDFPDFPVPELSIGDKADSYTLYSRSFTMNKETSSETLKEGTNMKALYFSKGGGGDNAGGNVPSKGGSIPTGGIVGIVIAVVIIIAAVVGSVILLIKIKKERHKSEEQSMV